MLQLLKVFNFALIEQAEIEFDNGFNVLTGETGAGKSMVVDALNVVLGGRSSVEMLRSGCEQFRIDAVFALQAHEPLRALLEEQAIPQEEDGLLFLSRSVSRQGKNTVLVNGTPAPLSLLRTIGSMLLDMHGQHENQALLRPESYLGLLDGSDSAIAPLLADYQLAFADWRKTRDKIAELNRDDRERAQRIDMLQWQVGEIEECHGGECSHQNVHPHRQDEEHHDGVGILHLGLCEDIRCRIAQQDTEQGVEKGDSDGIHKGIDGFGMRQEFLEIIERDVPILIGEREEHDEQQG